MAVALKVRSRLAGIQLHQVVDVARVSVAGMLRKHLSRCGAMCCREGRSGGQGYVAG